MKTELIQDAVIEARRFLLAVEKAEIVRQCAGHTDLTHLPKERGSIKRASMDPSRALSDLRNTK